MFLIRSITLRDRNRNRKNMVPSFTMDVDGKSKTNA